MANEHLASIIEAAIKAKEDSFFDTVALGSEALLHAPGLKLHIVTDEERRESLPARNRPRGVAYVDDLNSFIALVKAEEQADETAIFISAAKQTVEAVINHGAMGGDAHGHGWGWRDRRIIWKVKESRQLNAWKSLKQLHEQVAFAEFLEDHARDVVNPSAAAIQEMVLELEATSQGVCKAKQNLGNGSVALQFSDEVVTSVELPRQITIMIPLFDGGEAVAVKANFRLRIKDQKPTFCLTFPGLADLVEENFRQLNNRLQEADLQSLVLNGDCPA